MNTIPIDPVLLAAGNQHQNEAGTAAAVNAPSYVNLNHEELKKLCRTRKLKIGGTKAVLRARLVEDDQKRLLSLPPEPCTPSPRRENDLPEMPLIEADRDPAAIDDTQVAVDIQNLAHSFQEGFSGSNGDDDEESDEEDDTATLGANSSVELDVIDTPKTHDALAWADKFISDTRRKSGRETEKSVLKLWKSWVSIAIDSGEIPDIIVDANHTVLYLKYAATRQLFTRGGKAKNSSDRLSSSSLKKIMTMLGRVRRRQEDENPDIKMSRAAKNSRTDEFFKAVMIQSQRLRLESEDFDVTKGTVLDSELRPEQFKEVTCAIFKLNQLPSIIKAHFSWNWQCATLNRSDELVSLLLACIQPHSIRLPDYTNRNGHISPLHRSISGILTMYHETKTAKPGNTEPAYSFVLPHRDPLRCPIGSMAILLHYMFDQENLADKVPGWDWSRSSSWRDIHLLFGRTVEKPATGDAIGRMYASFLEHTSITSKKKAHIARRAIPEVMEDMGVPADQVDAIGHWAGNTRREVYAGKIPKLAVVALAGFPVGETYAVPWSRVKVPVDLEEKIFPFCERELARLRVGGCTNQGTMNFLNLLLYLRPFFWRTMASIGAQFPTSGIIQRLKVLENEDAKHFLQEWPRALDAEEKIFDQMNSAIEGEFREESTRNVISAFSERLNDLHSLVNRRTDQFSPSKTHTINHSRPSISRLENTNLWSFNNAPRAGPSSLALSPAIYSSASSTQYPQQMTPIYSRAPTPGPSITKSIVSATLTSNPQHPISGPLNRLIPISVSGPAGKIFYILPIVRPLPGNPPVRTMQDLILPPPEAFLDSIFPPFDTQRCTWHYIFSKITTPGVLWDTYAPKSLGDYPDIPALWQCWDEGTQIPELGRAPALRSIDEQWGNLPNQETRKRKYPLWRPRNDNKARKIWSNFYFFVHRIEAMKAAGNSSEQAVSHFENLRDKQSLSQLHKALQVKRKRPLNDEGDSMA